MYELLEIWIAQYLNFHNYKLDKRVWHSKAQIFIVTLGGSKSRIYIYVGIINPYTNRENIFGNYWWKIMWLSFSMKTIIKHIKLSVYALIYYNWSVSKKILMIDFNFFRYQRMWWKQWYLWSYMCEHCRNIHVPM